MKLLLSLVLIFATLPSLAHAQGLSIIRDTEIERTLDKWVEPILSQAGLSNDQVNIALVNSGDVNAFVAGGSNIFIYSGLIQTAEYPEEILGVIAHEVGHITGGHLIASRRAMEKASYQSMLAMVLGVGAAIATGDGGAASAISIGGSGLAQRGFYGHSRIQESAADQAGLKYLAGTDINPQGIVSFLGKLEGQELLPASQQSEYMRTHPLTRNRIDTMRVAVQNLSNNNPLGVSDKQADFDFIKAKLMAFREPQMVSRYYDANSDKDVDLYANGIMQYQKKNFDESISIFDRLINQNPKNPYFIEMKAQTLRDAGRLSESEVAYKKTLSMMTGDAPLIQNALAHVMIEQQKSGADIEDLLLSSIQSDSRDSEAYRLMATLKGRKGLEAEAQYYMAERATLNGRKSEARRLLALSLNGEKLPPALKIKANDLKLYLDRLPKADK